MEYIESIKKKMEEGDKPEPFLKLVQRSKINPVTFPATRYTQGLHQTESVPNVTGPTQIPNPGTCTSSTKSVTVSEPYRVYTSGYFGFLSRRTYILRSRIDRLIQVDCVYKDGSSTHEEYLAPTPEFYDYPIEGGTGYLEYENPILEFLNSYQVPLTVSIGIDRYGPSSFSVMGLPVWVATPNDVVLDTVPVETDDSIVNTGPLMVDAQDPSGGEAALVELNTTVSLNETVLVTIPAVPRLNQNQVLKTLEQITGALPGSTIHVTPLTYMNIFSELANYGYLSERFVIPNLDFNNYDYYLLIDYSPGLDSFSLTGRLIPED